MFDCIVVGAGPAGLSASLTLGRAKRNIAVFDDGTNRNRVTHESHGFITRDGIKPQEFKELGLKELEKYPSVAYFNTTITEIYKEECQNRFVVKSSDGHSFVSDKVVIATGIQEVFPFVSVREYYGKSLFSCPYCDGWELRDQPILVLAEKEEQALHMAKLVFNWSRDLVVLTNGVELSKEAVQELNKHNIKTRFDHIKNLIGENGYLQKIEFESGEILTRTGGFVVPSFYRPNSFAEKLGCEILEDGSLVTDGAGRTTEKHIYIAGETEKSSPSSLLISAAEGNKAGVAVNTDLIMERF